MIHLIVLLRGLCSLFILLTLARAISSWFNPDPRNTIIAFLNRLTDPLLRPVQNVLGVQGGIDFSPFVVILGLSMLDRLLVRLALSL